MEGAFSGISSVMSVISLMSTIPSRLTSGFGSISLLTLSPYLEATIMRSAIVTLPSRLTSACFLVSRSPPVSPSVDIVLEVCVNFASAKIK